MEANVLDGRLLRAYASLVASTHIGTPCAICGKTFESAEDVLEAVWYLELDGSGPHLAHSACLDAKHELQGAPE